MQDIKMPSGSLDSTMMSFSNWPYDVRSTFAQVAMRELHLPSQTQEKICGKSNSLNKIKRSPEEEQVKAPENSETSGGLNAGVLCMAHCILQSNRY